jgi:hypothetical protein
VVILLERTGLVILGAVVLDAMSGIISQELLGHRLILRGIAVTVAVPEDRVGGHARHYGPAIIEQRACGQRSGIHFLLHRRSRHDVNRVALGVGYE